MPDTYPTPLAAAVAGKIKAALPDAVITMEDPDGAHLVAHVVSSAFAGKPRVAQHRMVMAALKDAFEDDLHALQLTTQTA